MAFRARLRQDELMENGDLLFAMLAVNPLTGIMTAIPMAIFKLDYPFWLPALIGVPLTYVQVIIIDVGWDQLNKYPWWQRTLDKRRSPRIEKLMASGGSFWSTAIVTPMVGPWIVMAFMRYAKIPQRRVALPILTGMSLAALVITSICVYAPQVIAGW